MPRIAVFADVHANPFALDAVLADIAAQSVDETIVAGDLVGRGPLGHEVVARVRETGFACIRGNHEDYLINFRRGEVDPDWLTSPDWAASRWMAAQLSREDIAWLDALPFDGHAATQSELYVCHGSPRSHREGLGPWVEPEVLDAIVAGFDGTLMACAHTHSPFECEHMGRQLVNVGSVGMPFNGDPRAQYAIFSGPGGQGAWQLERRCVAYDRAPLRAAYIDSGFMDQGGATAQLLWREVELARSVLVPFLVWCAHSARPRGVPYPRIFQISRPRRGDVRLLRAPGARRTGMSSFGDIRSALHGAASSKSWRRLVHAFDGPGRLDVPTETAVRYAQDRLKGWPEELERPLPPDWGIEPETGNMAAPHPAIELGNALDVMEGLPLGEGAPHGAHF